MKQEVLFLILDNYADWEAAFPAAALNGGVAPDGTVKYVPRTVAPTTEPVRSIGGFRTCPDYDFGTMPDGYAALVLVGGTSWQSPEAAPVAGMVRKALDGGRIVGAICNGASYMAAHGFLNGVRHTGNTVDQLKAWGGDRYTNEAGYVEAQAVADRGIVTANGTGCLEFTRELLHLLKADTAERIDAWYDFHRNGFYR